MRLLLTNDDGIAAPGLQALLEVAAQLGNPVVAAPVECHSGCSHRVTTRDPIHVEERASARYAIRGTPADCIRIGLHGIVTGQGWILSGINAGGNLGADVHHSGTVAAVREGVLHGWPGVALSHYWKRGRDIPWSRAAQWTLPLLRDLMVRPWKPGTFWNINLPHLDSGDPDPEVVFCPVDPSPLPLSFRREGEHFHYDGDYHKRLYEHGTDIDVCFRGKIAVSQVTVF